MRGSPTLLSLAAAAALAGCDGAETSSVRPGDQPLAELNSPAALERIARAERAMPSLESKEGAGMCAEVLRVSEQGGLIRDRSNPNRLVVDGSLWGRVPETARSAIVQCAESARPDEARGPMRIVPLSADAI